jgi:hypothetical protein
VQQEYQASAPLTLEHEQLVAGKSVADFCVLYYVDFVAKYFVADFAAVASAAAAVKVDAVVVAAAVPKLCSVDVKAQVQIVVV